MCVYDWVMGCLTVCGGLCVYACMGVCVCARMSVTESVLSDTVSAVITTRIRDDRSKSSRRKTI